VSTIYKHASNCPCTDCTNNYEDNMTTTDTKSDARIINPQNWTQAAEKCVHGLPEFEQADTIRKTTIAALKKTGQESTYQVKVRKYPLRAKPGVKQTFSVLVFKRLKFHEKTTTPSTDSYVIDMSKNNELVTPKRPPIAGIVEPQDIDPSNLTATHHLKDKKRDRRHHGGKKTKRGSAS